MRYGDCYDKRKTKVGYCSHPGNKCSHRLEHPIPYCCVHVKIAVHSAYFNSSAFVTRSSIRSSVAWTSTPMLTSIYPNPNPECCRQNLPATTRQGNEQSPSFDSDILYECGTRVSFLFFRKTTAVTRNAIVRRVSAVCQQENLGAVRYLRIMIARKQI